MSETKIIKLGILGFGVVGQGVWKNIKNHEAALKKELGVTVEIVKAAVKDLGKSRDIEIPSDKLTDDPASIVNDPSIDIICELIGGTTLAKDLTLQALRNGKIVVTANKALICDHGAELFAVAQENDTEYFFEASVAGGIPIIKVLRESLLANNILSVVGILNGTSNYILTRMEKEGLPFEEILKEARALGYVEADEALDLDGIDAAHKTAIIAYLAHNKWVSIDDMVTEGIRSITTNDIDAARRLGFKIKLLAKITLNTEENLLSVSVYPSLISTNETLANVDDVFNGISITGDVVGNSVLIGRGAGQDPTSSSVISDICDAIKILQGAPKWTHSPSTEDNLRIATLDKITGTFYMRLIVKDQSGVLAEITNAMADHDISIATVLQDEVPNKNIASIILTTHETNEASIDKVIKAINALPSCLEEPVLLRIFDNGQ